jgi:hypothetical protein
MMGVQGSLFFFPRLLCLDTSVLESFSIGCCRVGFRSVCIGFGENTTIGLAFGFIFLLREPRERRVMALDRWVLGKFGRLPGCLSGPAVSLSAFSIPFPPSFLAFLLQSEGFLLWFGSDNLLHALIVEMKSNNQAKALGFFDPHKWSLVLLLWGFRASRAR